MSDVKTSKSKEDIIETIKKCLLLGKNEGTTEGERKAAQTRAAKLMAKYRIEETEVDLETDAFTLDTYEFYKDGPDVPQWVGQVIGVFCYTFDCQSVVRAMYDKKEWEVIGTFSDVETVLYFVDVICTHIKNEAWTTWPGVRNHKKRNQLGNVAAQVIWDRAWELKEQMDKHIHEDEGCTALVVKKAKEVKDAVNELYPNLTSPGHKKTDLPTDQKTLSAGKRAGKTAPMNFAIEN